MSVGGIRHEIQTLRLQEREHDKRRIGSSGRHFSERALEKKGGGGQGQGSQGRSTHRRTIGGRVHPRKYYSTIVMRGDRSSICGTVRPWYSLFVFIVKWAVAIEDVGFCGSLL
jgi:hypothetical protein